MKISVEHHDSVGEHMYCISVSKLPTQVTVSIRVLHVMGVCVCVCVCVIMYMSVCDTVHYTVHTYDMQVSQSPLAKVIRLIPFYLVLCIRISIICTFLVPRGTVYVLNRKKL